MGILDKIKDKPDHHKKIISLLMASLLTLIIVYIFLYVPNKQININKPKDKDLSSVSPFKAIQSQISDLFSGSSTDNLDDLTGASSTVIIETVDLSEDENATTTHSLDDDVLDGPYENHEEIN